MSERMRAMVSGERLKTALMGASIALIVIASALTYRTISALAGLAY
jgi:hypothetical protein